MNTKTINKVISKKINDWISSIDNSDLAKKLKEDVIVTGGCIASLLLGDEVNDYDVYVKTKQTASDLAFYYADKFNNRNGKDYAKVVEEDDRVKIVIRSSGVAADKDIQNITDEPFDDAINAIEIADSEAFKDDDTHDDKYRVLFLSSNAITLSNRIQLVIRFYGQPDEIHENYDFAHCTNYWTFGTGVVTNNDALQALLAKELVYMGSKYPLCSIIRTRKFIKRGYHINAGQYLKMCFQLNDMDLKDINVLEDQLIGVDSAYFSMLIYGLAKKTKEDSSFKITMPYVASIVDKIF